MLRRVAAQARLELALTLRRGESLLVTVAIPLGILVFFSVVDVLPLGRREPVDFLVPGTLALAIISTGMVSLGIATGFERQAGVLRRLAVTPLGRGGLLGAKTISTLAVIALQAIAIAVAGYVLGWRPSVDWALLGSALALGTLGFTAIGFALAGALRAETNLAVANALFLLLLLLGGIVLPASRLPGALEAVAVALPAQPLAQTLRAAFGAAEAARVPALGLWAAAAATIAAVTFRWD